LIRARPAVEMTSPKARRSRMRIFRFSFSFLVSRFWKGACGALCFFGEQGQEQGHCPSSPRLRLAAPSG
jgi:hypothetical protein